MTTFINYHIVRAYNNEEAHAHFPIGTPHPKCKGYFITHTTTQPMKLGWFRSLWNWLWDNPTIWEMTVTYKEQENEN